MTKQTYELEFDEKKLGPMWMNIDNLAAYLYGDTHTHKDLLKVRQVKTSRLRKFVISATIVILVAALLALAFFLIVMTSITVYDISRVVGG